MLPNLQHYTVAQSVREAVLLLTRNEGARIIAGGTVIARSSSPKITQLVDITKAGMDYIAEDDTGVRIGATVTFSAARESQEATQEDLMSAALPDRRCVSSPRGDQR